MRFLFFVLAPVCICMATSAQQVMPLYEGTIPNSKPFKNIESQTRDENGFVIIKDISVPTLTVYLPNKIVATGAAVIICPGGGYWVNAHKHEGTDVAQAFAQKGIAAFVLKYRLPDERWIEQTEIGPLQDAQQAMLIVKRNSERWLIDTARIGILGFSAGGHLAATLSNQYNPVLVANAMNHSVRPAFTVLVYPVISTDTSYMDRSITEKLIGKNRTPDVWQRFSADKVVTAQTPPAFIVHATDDPLTVRNSLLYYEALLRNNVKAEMHLYQGGGHGFGLHNKTTKDAWLERCVAWMQASRWMKKN